MVCLVFEIYGEVEKAILKCHLMRFQKQMGLITDSRLVPKVEVLHVINIISKVYTLNLDILSHRSVYQLYKTAYNLLSYNRTRCRRPRTL